MDKKTDKTIKEKRDDLSREAWIKNVLRIYPERTRKEAELLYHKLFVANA